MTYRVKEIFRSLQGEGAQTGRAAVFLRFAGCNLARGFCSAWCDTDFEGTDGAGGGVFADSAALAEAVARTWGPARERRCVICTGGEPLLQLDRSLIDALHGQGFEIAVETNGTIAAPAGIDWICVSPKQGAPLVQRAGDELKVVFPQADLGPQTLESFEALAFRHLFVQPRDGDDRAAHVRAAIDWCLAHPRWRLSLQTHKLLEIP